MNRKIALILLGTMCVIALINEASSAKATGKPAQTTVKASDASSEEEQHGKVEHGGKKHGGRGGRSGGGFRHGADFRKEIEKIFDEFKIDPATRDKILDAIKQRMEQFRKGKRHGGKHSSSDDKEEATTVKAGTLPTKI